LYSTFAVFTSLDPDGGRSTSASGHPIPGHQRHEFRRFLMEILGEWGWLIGGKVSFSQNAQARWTPGNVATPPASGTWRCDPRSGTYTVTWQNGFVDTLSLSNDGAQIAEPVLPALRSGAGEPPAQPGPCWLRATPPKRLLRVRLQKRGKTGGLLSVRAGLASRPRSPSVPVAFPSASVPKAGLPQRARGREWSSRAGESNLRTRDTNPRFPVLPG
jgi:hypothetical protein